MFPPPLFVKLALFSEISKLISRIEKNFSFLCQLESELSEKFRLHMA
jgi:hypothetical protein